MRDTHSMERRNFLAGLVAGSATLVIGGTPVIAIDSTQNLPKGLKGREGISNALLEQFHYIQPGVGIIEGWEIRDVSWVHGAVRIEALASSGASFSLDVCRKGAVAHGVESSENFDFLLMNDGKGVSLTETPAHQAVRILREVVVRTEADASLAAASMATHNERLAAIETKTLQFAT